MGRWKVVLGIGWLATAAFVAFAQQADLSVIKPLPASWQIKPIQFHARKPILGLALPLDHAAMNCAPNGTVFLDFRGDTGSASSAASRFVYSVSLTGETQALMWKRPPIELNQVDVLDTFAAADKLVSLVSAVKTDNGKAAEENAERSYFLSITGKDDSDSRLLRLDIKFKPLKIAMFENGEFLLLGWDRGNLIPEFVLLKDDGSILHFIDLDHRTVDAGMDPLTTGAAPSNETLHVLENARFTALGSEVVLAQEGGTAPLHVFNTLGGDSKIPIHYPGGFVLHDALPSEGYMTVLLRLEPKDDKRAWTKSRDTEGQRLFEFNRRNGLLLSELRFDQQEVKEVTSAPSGKVAAVLHEAIPGQLPSVGADGNPAPPAMQFVVATTSR